MKTNVMRILDREKIPYQIYTYKSEQALDGVSVAKVLDKDANQLFKTLVTVSKTNKYYVFMVPVLKQLDLKKAAISVNEKSLNMLPSKELLSLTGYIHGGCSPVGMKKLFPTVIDDSALFQDTIIFSGGKIGYQVELKLEDLKKVIPIKIENIIDSGESYESSIGCK